MKHFRNSVFLVFAFLAGAWFASALEPFRSTFQSMTGIHPESFIAAGRDCEAFHKRPCRLINGWTPRP